jgi:hypothetical protein
LNQPYRPDPTPDQQAILDVYAAAASDANHTTGREEDPKAPRVRYVVDPALVAQAWEGVPHYEEFYLRLVKAPPATPEQAASWRHSVRRASRWSLRVAGRHAFDAALSLVVDRDLARTRKSLADARYALRRAWVLCDLWLRMSFGR